jgi:hypothetical protein
VATNCLIGILNEDDSIKSIGCTCDGDPGIYGVGWVLSYWYTEFLEIVKLIQGGSILALKIDVESTHNFQKHESPNWLPPVIEDSNGLDDYINMARSRHYSYAYIYMSGAWWYKRVRGDEAWEKLDWKKRLENKGDFNEHV